METLAQQIEYIVQDQSVRAVTGIKIFPMR